jgi:hypothetical protein
VIVVTECIYLKNKIVITTEYSVLKKMEEIKAHNVTICWRSRVVKKEATYCTVRSS